MASCMDLSRLRSRASETCLLIVLTVSLAVNITVSESAGAPQQSDSYGYRFLVDEDGSAQVTINYTSSEKLGSSWVIVPRFLELSNLTRYGKILNYSFSTTREKVNTEYYFYRVLDFSFQSDGYFETIMQFNFTSAAMIIEPKGIFLSPLIGFEPGSKGRAEVVFPLGFERERAVAVAGYGYQPSYTNSNYVRFDDLRENTVRLQIEFKVSDDKPDLLKVENGVFTFEVARRYENYARDVLDLLNETYDDLVRMFDTTLEDINVEFFVPDFDLLFSIGGYVPFTGKELGNIHINIFYTRYVKGYIEVTALHELVHHFLWKAGLSPENLLWFHEGMAQYVSIEMAVDMGYEGASMTKQELEDGIAQLNLGNDLGFLSDWTPSSQPADWGTLYVAAYYVVSSLAEPYGGLEYYAQFFSLISGAYVDDNNELAYYLSLAANATVIPKLESWGFNVADFNVHSTLILEAEKSLSEISPISQPYKFLAEQLYKRALINAERGRVDLANQYLSAAIAIARLSPLLTLMTMSAVLFTAILYALKKNGLFSDQPL